MHGALSYRVDLVSDNACLVSRLVSQVKIVLRHNVQLYIYIQWRIKGGRGHGVHVNPLDHGVFFDTV